MRGLGGVRSGLLQAQGFTQGARGGAGRWHISHWLCAKLCPEIQKKTVSGICTDVVFGGQCGHSLIRVPLDVQSFGECMRINDKCRTTFLSQFRISDSFDYLKTALRPSLVTNLIERR